jgi:predicted double-glycine peptidase
LRGELRSRFDERSYLYNTDGLLFSDAGIPVVLINEHLNKLENLNRRAYHESTDVPSRVDWDYAEALTKTAIETAAQAASAAPPPRLPARIVALALVRQQTDYSCGAASMQSVLKYWRAFDGGEKELYGVLNTTSADGTEPQKLAEGARSFGLKADWRENLRFADLRAALERGDTPILAIQAWPDPGTEKASWRDDWDDGHYVALIGMDDGYAYFMDPSSDGKYAYITLPELSDRWHDAENRHGLTWRYDHLAVFIHGDGAPSAPAPRAPLQRMP